MKLVSDIICFVCTESIWSVRYTLSSSIEDLLGTLFEFTSSFVIKLLLFRGCSRSGGSHLLQLPTTGMGFLGGRVADLVRWGGICLLGYTTLSSRIVSGGRLVIMFGPFSDDVEHAIFERFLVFL